MAVSDGREKLVTNMLASMIAKEGSGYRVGSH